MFKDFSLKGLLQSAVAKVASSGAMNPILWLAGIVVPLCSILLYLTDNVVVQVFFCALIAYTVWYATRAFDYFMKRSPQLLQSEVWQIENRKLELMGDDRLGREMEPSLLRQKPEPNRYLSNGADQ